MILADGSFAYELGDTVGVGASGKVKVGVHKETGERVAVKIMEVSEEKLQVLERESVIQHSVVHPNVVRCLGKHMDGGKMYVVMELIAGGELFQYLIKNGKMCDEGARKLLRQLISALRCCHDLNICHRDIKPENLMLDDKGNLKLGDFGYAQWMHCISDKTAGWVDTSCGSPHYASPEVIRGGRYVGKQADVWSSGVVLFALVTGGLPFDHESTQRLLAKVCEGKFRIPHWVTPAAADLIRRMLTVDPTRRITTDEIQQHPWFLGNDERAEVAAPAAPTVRKVGRFSCQAAQPETERVATSIANEFAAEIPPPPLLFDDEAGAAATGSEQHERCDTPASRMVIMGHTSEPAAVCDTSRRSKSGINYQLDTMMELGSGSFGSAGSLSATLVSAMGA